MENKKIFWGYPTAVGCFVIMFVHLGMLTTIGLFIPAIAGGIGASISQVSQVIAVATLGSFVTSFFVSKLITKLSAKRLLILATISCAAHFFIYGISPNVFVVYIGGVFGGFAMGAGANAVNASILSSWFIEKRSSVIGLVFGGAAFGGAVTQFVAGRLIDSVGWRSAYFILAVAILVLGISANIIFIRDPNKVGQKPLGWEKFQAAAGGEEAAATSGMLLTQARKSVSFWLIMVGVVFCGVLITGFTSFSPSYWQLNGMSQVDSSQYISLFSLIGAFGTMLAGFIANKFGNKVFIAYMMICYIVGMVLMVMWPNNMTATFTMLAVCITAFSFPLSTSVPATVTTESFGNRDYTKICAWFMAALYLGKAMSSVVLGSVLDITGSLRGGFVLLGIFAGISLVCIFVGILLAHKKTVSMEKNLQKAQQ